MPLVRPIIRPNAPIRATELFEACFEIVPAGFNSPMGPLTPGSIEFDSKRTERAKYLTVDVFLEIEAFPYEDRDPQRIANDIHDALSELFPGVSFAVWSKPVEAGYASDSDDPLFDGDMSMPAAIERAREKVGSALLPDPAH